MAATPLSEAEVTSALLSTPGWSGDTNGISRILRFKTFGGAIAFMQACVPGIDALDHHPTWTNTHNRLSVHVNTGDAGEKVTKLDFELAAMMNRLLTEHGADFGYAP